MSIIRPYSDKAAIGISFLCLAHCLIIPLSLSLLPTSLALSLQDEIFHFILVLLAVPLSLFALFVGCKSHQRYRVFVLGGIGIAFLVSAILLGHDVIGDFGEKAFTVIGSLLIAFGHVWNFRLCQRKDQCDCD